MTTPGPGWLPLRRLLSWLPLPPYLLDEQVLASARDELRAVGFEIAEVDASEVRDERDLLTLIGAVLNFPDYYRPNWDALDDCIGDLMREGAPPTAVLVTGAEHLLTASPYDFVRAVHMLYTVVEAIERDAGAFRLEVLFLGRWGP
jgi:RNAse (barnase) inhibitor barstar